MREGASNVGGRDNNVMMDVSCPCSPLSPCCSQHRLSFRVDSVISEKMNRRNSLQEATRETLRLMRQLESTTYKRPLAQELPEPFHGLWRQQIVEWMYTLVNYCKLSHESATAAIYYLDVAVAHGLVTSPSRYQLGSMTALYLALKIYDSPSMRVVKLSSLIKLGNGEFDEQDVVGMEREIVQLLQWRLNPPTVNCFVQQYLSLLFSDKDDCSTGVHAADGAGDEASPQSSLARQLEEIALQCIELVMGRDYFLTADPSVIGYAVLLMAIEILDQRQTSAQRQDHPWSLLDLQAFLYRMSHVAILDHTSPALVRVSILLDRTMKSLPISTAMIRMEEETSSSTTESNRQREDFCQDSPTTTVVSNDMNQFVASACADGHSPNFVALQ
jgi:hypothetical protein